MYTQRTHYYRKDTREAPTPRDLEAMAAALRRLASHYEAAAVGQARCVGRAWEELRDEVLQAFKGVSLRGFGGET